MKLVRPTTKKRDLQKAIRQARKHFLSEKCEENYDGDKPLSLEHINCGWCDIFAKYVRRLLKFPSNLSITDDFRQAGDEYSHTFLVYKGKYYDAECIDGVDDWRLLPFFIRVRQDAPER